MKKLLLTLFTIQLTLSVIGQSTQLESFSAISEEKNVTSERLTRLIVLTDRTITISNWLDGGKEPLKLKIDKVVNKKYSDEGVCTWYYCTSLEKDFISGEYRKTIIIKIKDKLKVNSFASEVDVYNTTLLLREN